MAVSTWKRRGGAPRFPHQLSTMVDDRQHEDITAFAGEENQSLSQVTRDAIAAGMPVLRRRARARRGQVAA